MISDFNLLVLHGGIFVLIIPNAVTHLLQKMIAIAARTISATGMLFILKNPEMKALQATADYQKKQQKDLFQRSEKMTPRTEYTDLGLVNTSQMFTEAMQGGYAIPAYNFNNMQQLQAIVTGCVESQSPVILQVSGRARQYADP